LDPTKDFVQVFIVTKTFPSDEARSPGLQNTNANETTTTWKRRSKERIAASRIVITTIAITRTPITSGINLSTSSGLYTNPQIATSQIPDKAPFATFGPKTIFFIQVMMKFVIRVG